MHAPAKSNRIGQPVPRKEDLRLITGKGRYTDDLNLEGQAYAAMVRSPHAHAVIRSIDAEDARAVPGVLAVLTGADFIADRLNPIPNKTFSLHPAEMPLVNSDGTPAPDHIGWLYDITNEKKPTQLSTLTVPRNPGDFCDKGGRFGAHASSESFYRPYYGKLAIISHGWMEPAYLHIWERSS